jgi:hypothetical protein
MSSTRRADSAREEETPKRGGADHPLAYAMVLVIAACAVFAYELRTNGIFACGADGYGDDTYLAYCNSVSYGDYDHGALWFDYEPLARERAAAAQVMFLGSSRMEFAFSTIATDDWFATHDLSYYLLGFSHTENVTFVAPLLEKIAPRASAYVINIDGFFDDRETEPVAAIGHGDNPESRYSRKRIWQAPHRVLCSAVPSLCGDSLGFFRTRATGTWTFHGTDTLVHGGIADAPIKDRAAVNRRIEIGREFVAELPVERGCVFFTVAPWAATPREEAETVAAALGVELLAPRGENLHTFDGSHLDDPSAEIWSQQFFASAGEHIERCVERNRGGTSAVHSTSAQ